MSQQRLQQIVETLKEYDYQNEAGYLTNCILFKELEEMAKPVEPAFVIPKLERPLCVLDTETTGTNTQSDQIVEICIIKLDQDMNREVKTMRFKPTIPIPKQASDVHGITDDMVKDCPAFKQVAKGIHAFIQGCDLAGFNCNRFDIPILFFEFERAGVDWDYKAHAIIDIGNIFKIKEPRTLESAVNFYLHKAHDTAHSAEGDVTMTGAVLWAMLGKYPDLPQNISSLATYSNFDKPWLDVTGKLAFDEDGDIIFTFGKNIGQKAKKDKSYLEWIIYKSDFPKDVKKICTELYITK
jgi:DNA polymerase-3 subunit epsilon